MHPLSQIVELRFNELVGIAVKLSVVQTLPNRPTLKRKRTLIPVVMRYHRHTEIYDANFQFNKIYIQRSNKTDCVEPVFSNERHSFNLHYIVNINVIPF